MCPGRGMYLKFKVSWAHLMSMFSKRVAGVYLVVLFMSLVYNAYMAQTPQS